MIGGIDPRFLRRDEAGAHIGEVGAQYLGGANGGAGRDRSGHHQRAVEHLANLGHQDQMADIARMAAAARSEEHTSELQSLMRISYAVFCLKKKKKTTSQ